MEFCDSTDHEGSQTQPPWRLPHPGLLLLPKNQPLSLGTLSPLIPSPLLHLQSPTAAAEKGLRRRPTTGGEEEDEEEENGGGAEERRRDEGGVNGMDQGFGGQVGGALGAGSDVGEEDCYDENEMFEEDEEEEEGDVEELVGEIVYRPDGSAFVGGEPEPAKSEGGRGGQPHPASHAQPPPHHQHLPHRRIPGALVPPALSEPEPNPDPNSGAAWTHPAQFPRVPFASPGRRPAANQQWSTQR
ncbi:zinc finger and BTB domain-containing protein 47-like [Alosa sapidissima]|uniref:zinc finger and BTB domain-containing protein 47-like n=1 Tax=Alosa sapidissima TaxID=34773 RepID=UPI001C0818B3|nr:zinc finger and BTB domain-containing protein 47-like [Alosa sapidissima]XP_041964819.1 zinc finger and BTB domain-containing protein 47-like [Alosa sapidissima]XP_041964820.1 zinc finger and BTB domain-containing protein 47-like [Alosa sapidissima]